MGIGLSGKQFVPFKRGFGFESPYIQQYLLITSPTIIRYATRSDHQISRGNPDTKAGNLKNKDIYSQEINV